MREDRSLRTEESRLFFRKNPKFRAACYWTSTHRRRAGKGRRVQSVSRGRYRIQSLRQRSVVALRDLLAQSRRCRSLRGRDRRGWRSYICPTRTHHRILLGRLNHPPAMDAATLAGPPRGRQTPLIELRNDRLAYSHYERGELSALASQLLYLRQIDARRALRQLVFAILAKLIRRRAARDRLPCDDYPPKAPRGHAGQPADPRTTAVQSTPWSSPRSVRRVTANGQATRSDQKRYTRATPSSACFQTRPELLRVEGLSPNIAACESRREAQCSNGCEDEKVNSNKSWRRAPHPAPLWSPEFIA